MSTANSKEVEALRHKVQTLLLRVSNRDAQIAKLQDELAESESIAFRTADDLRYLQRLTHSLRSN